MYDDLGELEARSDARAQEEDQSEHDHASAQRPWKDDEHVAQALCAIEFARDTLQAEPSQLSTLSHTLPGAVELLKGLTEIECIFTFVSLRFDAPTTAQLAWAMDIPLAGYERQLRESVVHRQGIGEAEYRMQLIIGLDVSIMGRIDISDDGSPVPWHKRLTEEVDWIKVLAGTLYRYSGYDTEYSVHPS